MNNAYSSDMNTGRKVARLQSVSLDVRWLPNGEDRYIVDLIYMLIGCVRQDEHSICRSVAYEMTPAGGAVTQSRTKSEAF